MIFLIDKEVDLKKQDFLNTSSYSNALLEVIRNSPVENSFTIGLFGEWGSGKSSIVKTVEEEFRSTKNVKFVIYDSWKYSNDSFRRMFLLKLQEDLGFEKTEKFKSFYSNKSSDLTVKRKVEWKYILYTIIVMLSGILCINFLPEDKIDSKITFSVIIATIGILINILGRAFNDYKVSVQEPMLFAPEQFEDCFNDMIPRVFEKGIKHNVSKWIKGESYISGLEKLIIVIDNIDRCQKDKAYEMITNIKSFLSTQKQLIFLIPVDDDALKRHIIEEEKEGSKEAEEFLRKFFNVTIRIKPFKRFDLYDFTNRLNKDYKIDFNPTTIDIISKEYATNPRRIIQFFNDLIAELKFFELSQSKDFILKNESLICKMLILRQEWPDFYKKISKDSSKINDFQSNINIQDKNEDLYSFLKVTESITKNEPLSIIETILSTFDRESKLSADTLTLVNKRDFKAIVNHISEQKVDLDDLINFLIERLNLEIKRKTFRTSVNNTFELICLLDSEFNINKSQNLRIETEVNLYLNDFFLFISNSDSLISYGIRLKTIELPYLDNFIIRYMSNLTEESHDDNIYSNIIKLFRKYISNNNCRPFLSNLSTLFEADYKNSISRFEEYELDKEQLSNIVNDNVITIALSKISTLNINDLGYNEILYLSNMIHFTNESFKTIITKFNELLPSFNNLPKEQIIEYLTLINNFLYGQVNVVSDDLTEIEALSTLKETFLSNRIFNGRMVTILSDSLSQNEILTISNFLKYINICSNYNVATLQELESLIVNSPSEGQEIVNIHLIELKNDYSLNVLPFKELILNDNTWDMNSFELFEYISTLRDESGNYQLDENLISNKISLIINELKNDFSNELILGFLTKITNDERTNKLLSLIITNLTKGEILQLPQNLQILSFDKILVGDSIYEYQEQLDFLKAIAINGEMKHIHKLVMVITNKMTKEDTFEDGIDILNEVRELKSSDKQALLGIIKSRENSTFKERALNIINRF